MSGIAQTVLICDDSESITRLIEAVLADEGYELKVAASVEQAVAELDGSPPDLVVTDLYMPGGGAVAIIEHMRGDPDLAAIPVLLVSGSVEALSAHGAQSVGADAHLPKPFRADALRRSVRDLLSR
jgi:CheY-like chemotaxis protein